MLVQAVTHSPTRSPISSSPDAMDPTPGRDLEAIVEGLMPDEPHDSEGLDSAAGRFDQIARELSEALSRAQG